MQRDITRARESGRKSIPVDLDTFLHAMQLDHRGGIEEVEAVLEEMCDVCYCECTRTSENHREVITFVLSHSGSFLSGEVSHRFSPCILYFRNAKEHRVS